MISNRIFELVNDGKHWVGQCLYYARQHTPGNHGKTVALCKARHRTEALLDTISREDIRAYSGRVLLDAMFDNPGYWFRYGLLRTALGLAGGEEVGILGCYRKAECRRTLEHLGISKSVRYPYLAGDTSRYRNRARGILRETYVPADILSWDLPFGFPGSLVYDGIQKLQRKPVIDLQDPLLERYVVEALQCLGAADRLLSPKTSLVVLSHAINHEYGPLAWIAAQRKIPVVVLTGFNGTPRFWKIRTPDDVYRIASRPSLPEMNALSPDKRHALAKVFREYMDARMAGQAKDIGAWYAYNSKTKHLSRQEIAKKFDWDPAKPIVAVYAPHWFDGPHLHGMKNFRDFLDWLESLLEVVKTQDQVNWLFKNHPCEDFYGGITLHDLTVSVCAPHIGLVERDWNNASVINSADAIVTYHGTIGVEAAACGKPVLVADEGWYHDLEFVVYPGSRDAFLSTVTTPWWESVRCEDIAERAQVLGGAYFCIIDDQRDIVIPDDATQSAMYPVLEEILKNKPKNLADEASHIRDWWNSDDQHYHVYRMKKSDRFVSPISTSTAPGFLDKIVMRRA